ncbi:hypothetical protein TcasGA2_TC012088 [Tribolium castaneum]|uniref:Uncharacterized protein n=1 Tax=Tribolium castaneum TaxID=7070 RepID=D6X216_TRICA|nr:hypothetical protein TcasGA2_TC012088 [Tribolium castaneum]
MAMRTDGYGGYGEEAVSVNIGLVNGKTAAAVLESDGQANRLSTYTG